MVKVRQDAWSHEDDLLLAETVLRHIREGSTQLNAFEEVGDKLNRTSAACGFRWNAEIRNKYDSAIDLAKRQRKEKKRAMDVVTLQPEQQSTQNVNAETDTETNHNRDNSPLTLDSIIQYLSRLNVDLHDTNRSKVTIKELKEDNKLLQRNIEKLKKDLAHTEAQLQTIQEDYQTFITIMERARKMTVFDDHGSHHTPKFRMDKNGNLEQVSHGPN